MENVAKYKKGTPNGVPFVNCLAAAAAIVVAAAVVATEYAVVAAAAEQDQQDDDPPAVIATETVITHKNTSKNDVAALPLIPWYSTGEFLCA